MCHGAGGMAGHVRFGARTATAPVLIGLIFMALGLALGKSGYLLLKTIPDTVLGALLLFSGIELAFSAKLHEQKGEDLFLVLLIAAIGVAINPAAAFAVGLPTAYASMWNVISVALMIQGARQFFHGSWQGLATLSNQENVGGPVYELGA